MPERIRRPGSPMPEKEIEELLRRLAPQVLSAVVRRYGRFDLAEDAVQEALLAAALQWPAEGIPDDPRAWAIAVAARRLTDLLRSEQARLRREDTVARWTLPDQWLAPPADRASPDGDDTLILLFLCCHPALTPESTAMAKDLKKRGFRFVGPTTAYALMQATGMVNDHLVDCWRRSP